MAFPPWLFPKPRRRRSRSYGYRPRWTVQRRLLYSLATLIVAGLGWLFTQITGFGRGGTTPPGVESSQEPGRSGAQDRNKLPQAKPESTSTSSAPGAEALPSAGTERIIAAFKAKRSNFFAEAEGVVKAVLPDDTAGTPHQRFILELPGGHTVMISHNLAIAERVPVRLADTVRFRGEYEWNEQGGIIHWTHRDPDGRMRGGWIEFAGKTYK